MQETHPQLLLPQLSLQLGDVRLQLLLLVLPPLFALSDGGVHLDPELRPQTILALGPGGVRAAGARRVDLHVTFDFFFYIIH